MFMLCKCRELDLRSFDTAKVKNMMGMFCGSRWLEHIYVSSWSKKNLTISKDMFFGCDSLPNYDRNRRDAEMAYVGGYFEWKSNYSEGFLLGRYGSVYSAGAEDRYFFYDNCRQLA